MHPLFVTLFIETDADDLREGLGPELADSEIEDLNPQRLAHKHLFGDLNADQAAQQQPAANGTPLPGPVHEYRPSPRQRVLAAGALAGGNRERVPAYSCLTSRSSRTRVPRKSEMRSAPSGR